MYVSTLNILKIRKSKVHTLTFVLNTLHASV